MASPVLVQKCLEADYDAVTGTCAAPFWEAVTDSVATLSLADAQTIGWHLALLWATAWCFRAARKALQEIG